MTLTRFIHVAVLTLVLGTSGVATTLLHQSVHMNVSSPSSVSVTTYQLPNGKIWGHLQKLNHMTDYQVNDTKFASDPVQVSAALQQPQYFRVFQNSDGSESLNLALTSPGHVLTSIHFAFSPHEHTSLIAVGVPTAAFLQHNHVTANAQGATAYQSATSQSSPASPTADTGKTNTVFKPTKATTWQSSYTIDTTWNDPAFIPVNEVKTSMTCTVDGNAVSGCHGSDYRWWLSNDGWYEYSHSIGTYYAAYDHGVTWTHDHFRNEPFCAGNWTDVYFHDNEVDILGDGSQYANLSTDQTGACGWMLSYSDTLS